MKDQVATFEYDHSGVPEHWRCVMILGFWVLTLTGLSSAHAQDRPSPGPPEALVELVNNLRLGVRLEGGVLQSRLSVPPIEERGMRYLDRPVRAELAPTTSPLYGVGAGLRWDNRAELFGAYRLNEGLGSETALRFQDGGRAVPATYDVRQWEVRAHYFVHDNVGLGVVYRDELISADPFYSFTVMGIEVSKGVFSANSWRRSLSLYVPVRFPVSSRTKLVGRVGTSVYGRSREDYDTHFTLHQDPDRPNELFPVPINGENASIEAHDAGLSRPFARVGVERPLFGMTWRLFVQAERVSVGDVAEEWRGGARLQVGLPF